MGATLHSRLPQIIARAEAKATTVVDTVGKAVAQSAQDKARRLSNDMAEGIEYENTGPGRGRVTANDFKTHFHEYGTSKMSAQPMLGPAAEEWREPFKRLLARIVK